MAKRNLSDLLKEEVKKTAGDESTIDVPASEVKDMNKQTKTTPVDLEATVKELQETLEKTRKNEETLQQQASGFQSTIAEQEKLFKQLQKEVDEAKKLGNLQDTVEDLKLELAAARKNEKSLEKLVGELQLTLKEKDGLAEKLEDLQDTAEEFKQELTAARKNEKSLEKLVGELQLTLQEKDALAEKLNIELYAAKKDALQLAEANTKLTAEVNTAQKIAQMDPPAIQAISRQLAPKQRVPNQSAITQPKKDYSSSLAYRKHYSRPTDPFPKNQTMIVLLRCGCWINHLGVSG